MHHDTRHNEAAEDGLAAGFAEDGFVALRSFLGGEELSEMLENVDRFLEHVLPGLPPEHVFFEDKQDPKSLKQIQQMGDHDRWFDERFRRGRFRDLAEQLLAGPVTPKNMQYFNKPPLSGKSTPPHQDGFYFMLEPCEALTMWLALDEVDEENGCVRYVPGSQNSGLRDHATTGTLGFSQGIVEYTTDNELPMSASPGDLLAHHALTIHRADGNRSATRSRRALGLIYYSERAREDAAAHARYQQKLADELKAAGRI